MEADAEAASTLIEREPIQTQNRIRALKSLIQQAQAVEARRRLLPLGERAPLLEELDRFYDRRDAVVIGSTNANEIIGDDELLPVPDNEEVIVGLPSFWADALHNHPIVYKEINDRDMQLLQLLTTIREVPYRSQNDGEFGFTIEFHFAPTAPFRPLVLRKSYSVIYNEVDEMEVTRVRGTKITWPPNGNPTIEGPERSCEVVSSFFHFFDPARLAQLLDADEEDREIMKLDDFVMGLAILEDILPRAVLWFTSEATEEYIEKFGALDDAADEDADDDDKENDDDDDDDDDNDDDEDNEQMDPSSRRLLVRLMRYTVAGPKRFIDAQEMHRQHPATFEVPTPSEVQALVVGRFVKIAINGERFWVEITRVEACESDPFHTRFFGRIDNMLITTPHSLDDRVVFEGRHIYAIMIPEN